MRPELPDPSTRCETVGEGGFGGLWAKWMMLFLIDVWVPPETGPMGSEDSGRRRQVFGWCLSLIRDRSATLTRRSSVALRDARKRLGKTRPTLMKEAIRQSLRGR